MMQSCASAAKLRGGGPILRYGLEARSDSGSPPPRIIFGDWRRFLPPEHQIDYILICSLHRPQCNAYWYFSSSYNTLMHDVHSRNFTHLNSRHFATTYATL